MASGGIFVLRKRRVGLSAIVGTMILILIVFSIGVIVYNLVTSFVDQSSISRGKRVIDILSYDCKDIDFDNNVVKVCIRNLGSYDVVLDAAYIEGGGVSGEAFIGQVIRVSISYRESFGELVTSVLIGEVENINPGFLSLNITVRYDSNNDSLDSLIDIAIDFEGGGLKGTFLKEVGLADGGSEVNFIIEGVVYGNIEDGLIMDQIIYIDSGENVGYGYISFDKVFIEPGSAVVVWIRPIEGYLSRGSNSVKVTVTTYEGGILVVNI